MEYLEDDFIDDVNHLQDPLQTQEQKFDWSPGFQQYVISNLLCDQFFATQAEGLIEPSHFVSDVHIELCKILFEYMEKYKAMPSRVMVEENVYCFLKKTGKSEEDVSRFKVELNNVYENYIPSSDSREAILEKIVQFAKLQSIKDAFSICMQKLKKDSANESTWIKIQDILQKALSVDRNFDIGLNYFEEIEERFLQMQEDEEKGEIFTSGFEGINEKLSGGGCKRGQVFAWVGLSGSGKSLALVNAAVRNISLKKKVLYVSLEMSQLEVAERFDAQISNININKILENKEAVKQALAEEIEGQEDGRLLIIKRFPPGQLSLPDLRAYLQQLEINGFKPDLLVLDYIGEMKDYPDMPVHESRYKIVRDLGALSVDLDILVYTALQPNKTAKEVIKNGNMFGGIGVIDDDNIGDSYAQIKPLHGCWSLNRTQDEIEADVGRIFVIKHRNGQSRYVLYVEFNRETLCINQISRNKYDKIMQEYESNKEERKMDGEIEKAQNGFAGD